MHIQSIKNAKKQVNYEKNLKSLLGWEDTTTKILKKSAGILRGTLKKSSTLYQKTLRKEWESRVKKLEKLATKK